MYIVRRTALFNTLVLAGVVGGTVAVIGGQIGAVWSLVGLVPAGLILAGGLRQAFRRWKRAKEDVTVEEKEWLSEHIPLYRRFDEEHRRRFERDVQFILADYTFEGIQDVEVTDSLRLSVAAGAALLLHGRPSWELPGSQTVLFYPERFNETYYDSAHGEFDGMAHQQGPIILTAPAVEASWAHPEDGDNVVLHELAHLFDFDNEGADGVPSLVASGSAAHWQKLVRNEMRRVRNGRSILRPYAAEAPSEFFAVAVESFFEQPDRMHKHHDELFAALLAIFQFDPRTGRKVSLADDSSSTGEEEPV